MKQETLFISFATVKGGVGKSALTIIAANYFHFVKGYNTLVIDCDTSQFSVYNQRQRETSVLLSSPEYKHMLREQTERTGKKPFPIIRCSIQDVPQELERYARENKEHIDIVLFDMRGSLQDLDVVMLTASMHYIFLPIKPDMNTCASSVSFAAILNERYVLQNKGNLRGIYIFWYNVDNRESKSVLGRCEQLTNTLGLPQLSVAIPWRSRYNKELGDGSTFKTTFFPAPEEELKESKMTDLLEEICDIIEREDEQNG